MNQFYIDVKQISGRTARRIPRYPGEHGKAGKVVGMVMRHSALCYIIERSGRIEEWFTTESELIN